jgi:flagellar biosynthesis protein FlhB
MREEMRSQNGDPGVQRRRRQVQRDLALTHLRSSNRSGDGQRNKG